MKPGEPDVDLGAALLIRAEGLSGAELDAVVTDGCAQALALERELDAARRELEELCEAIASPGGLEGWRQGLERRRRLESGLAALRNAIDDLMGAGRELRPPRADRFRRDPLAPRALQPGHGSPHQA